MCIRKLIKHGYLALLAFPSGVFASTSIGDIADTLLGPTAILTKLLILACYIIGVAFILMALAQYKIHRQSPKLVPLGTPVTLLILGVVALFVPYVTNQFETGDPGKHVGSESRPTVLPMPDTSRSKGPALPLPGQRGERSDQAAPPPSSEPVSPGGGGWTQDPRYNQ